MNCIPILQHQHYNSVKTKFEGLNHSLLISVLKLPVCNKCTALWLISAHFYLFGFSVTLEDSVLRIHELNTFIQIRSAPVTFEYSAKAKTLSAKYTKIYFLKTPKTFFTQVLYCFRWKRSTTSKTINKSSILLVSILGLISEIYFAFSLYLF